MPLDRLSGVHHKSGDFCRIAGEIIFLLAKVRRSRFTQQSSMRSLVVRNNPIRTIHISRFVHARASEYS